MSTRLIFLSQKKTGQTKKQITSRQQIFPLKDQYVSNDWQIQNIETIYDLGYDEQKQVFAGLFISKQYDTLLLISKQSKSSDILMKALIENYTQDNIQNSCYIDILINLCKQKQEYFISIIQCNVLIDMLKFVYQERSDSEKGSNILKFYTDMFREYLIITLPEEQQVQVINNISTFLNVVIIHKKYFYTQSSGSCFDLYDLIKMFIPYINIYQYIQTIYELMFSTKKHNQIISLRLLSEFIKQNYEDCEICINGHNLIADLIQQFGRVQEYAILHDIIEIIYWLVNSSQKVMSEFIRNIQTLDTWLGDIFYTDSRWIQLNQLLEYTNSYQSLELLGL